MTYKYKKMLISNQCRIYNNSKCLNHTNTNNLYLIEVYWLFAELLFLFLFLFFLFSFSKTVHYFLLIEEWILDWSNRQGQPQNKTSRDQTKQPFSMHFRKISRLLISFLTMSDFIFLKIIMPHFSSSVLLFLFSFWMIAFRQNFSPTGPLFPPK